MSWTSRSSRRVISALAQLVPSLDADEESMPAANGDEVSERELTRFSLRFWTS